MTTPLDYPTEKALRTAELITGGYRDDTKQTYATDRGRKTVIGIAALIDEMMKPDAEI